MRIRKNNNVITFRTIEPIADLIHDGTKDSMDNKKNETKEEKKRKKLEAERERIKEQNIHHPKESPGTPQFRQMQSLHARMIRSEALH